MLPNISEDQVLIKYFKYFDLENSGRATLREFIKTMDKVGVVLGKVHDIETIFNYYDNENLGSLDYKKFISELFSRLKRKEERIDSNYKKNDKTENNRYLTNNLRLKESTLDKLHNFLKPLGAKGLISFCKEFKVIRVFNKKNSHNNYYLYQLIYYL
jgi:hypothetical protein